MDRGAWRAIVHGVAELDMSKHTHTGASNISNVKSLFLPRLSATGCTNLFPSLSLEVSERTTHALLILGSSVITTVD